MKKLFILPCLLSAVFFLCCRSSVSLVFAEEGSAENAPIDQTEPTEPTVPNDSATAGDETADSLNNTSDDEKSDSDEGSLPQTSADETANHAEAVKKPLVIDGLVLTDAERRVFELTNAERKKRGLPALRLDRRLMESARRQANWMARTGIFRHGNSGYAENIAMGQRSSRDVVVAWMQSAGHFRNMMNRGHGAIGIGSYRGPNGALFWCQQFSR